MKRFLLVGLIAFSTTSHAQSDASAGKTEKIVTITGVRFAYPLIQKWIDDYNKSNPEVQIIIESRGTGDPSKYDILVEAYEPEVDKTSTRDYFYVARYAVLPVANGKSEFSKIYAAKGLHRDLIKQLFFHDIFASKSDQAIIKEPFTVYTRLQKAGAPVTFARYFGYQQKDIHGKSIAGADEHMLKALIRDSTALTYLPLNLLFDLKTGLPLEGITILPVDLSGNGKVSDDEKIYQQLSGVIERFESKEQKEINNIPIEHLNLSIEKKSYNADAVAFLKWIVQHAEHDLHAFGYLKPTVPLTARDKQNE